MLKGKILPFGWQPIEHTFMPNSKLRWANLYL
nr:MAG TPA: hypothetical protein [Caudoviricetes sp.]